jgi:2,4-dienoyl-CoA reductase-like NADH-dependent reductase (Old Yellow Enzyme family)
MQNADSEIHLSKLFEKTTLKGIELKNRLIRSATHEGLADSEGFPTSRLLALYERLAQGDVALIITGHGYVCRDGKSQFPGMLGIDSDGHIPQYRDMVTRVHESGSRIAMQLVHCGRQTTPEAAGTQPIAPSAVKEKNIFVKPREMTHQDIQRVIRAFGQAARRVKESGFDALQLHAAHGYLINQFLDPYTNRRRDQWGGSLLNRLRFLHEIYRECRHEVGEDFPIMIKFSAYDIRKDGLQLSEGTRMAIEMANMGFDAIEVSCGIWDDRGSSTRGDLPIDVILDEWEMYKTKGAFYRYIMKRFGKRIIRPVLFEQAYNREAARRIKGQVSVPVVVVGGLVDPRKMGEVIASGDADYIALCRALIADPGFPKKVREGDTNPSRCIHCNLCMYYLATQSLHCYHGRRISK